MATTRIAKAGNTRGKKYIIICVVAFLLAMIGFPVPVFLVGFGDEGKTQNRPQQIPA